MARPRVKKAATATNAVSFPRVWHKATSDGDSTRVTGLELLCAVSGHMIGPAGHTTGSMHTSVVADLNPATWQGSRLQHFARSFEKYRYDRVRLVYQPASASTNAGVLAYGIEIDPEDDLPGKGGVVDTTIRQCLNSPYSQVASVWQSSQAVWARNRLDTALHQASVVDGKYSTPGYAYAYTNASGLLGYLLVEYDVTFLYPELDIRSVISTENALPQQFRTGEIMINGAAGGQTFLNTTPNLSTEPTPERGTIYEMIVETVSNATDSFLYKANAAGNTQLLNAGTRFFAAVHEATDTWLFSRLSDAIAMQPIMRMVAVTGGSAAVGVYARRLISNYNP